MKKEVYDFLVEIGAIFTNYPVNKVNETEPTWIDFTILVGTTTVYYKINKDYSLKQVVLNLLNRSLDVGFIQGENYGRGKLQEEIKKALGL